MKKGSIREIRHQSNCILERMADGEEADIANRLRSVASLAPAPRRKAAPNPMPDITSRLQKVFGKKVITAKEMAKILGESRSAF